MLGMVPAGVVAVVLVVMVVLVCCWFSFWCQFIEFQPRRVRSRRMRAPAARPMAMAMAPVRVLWKRSWPVP